MRFGLVASSDIHVQDFLKKVLEAEFAVLLASTGQDALRILTEKPVDVMFLDTVLPDYKGLTLLEKISRMDICTSVIVILPPDATTLIRDTEKLRNHEIIYKPLERDQVKLALSKALKKRDLVQRIQFLQSRVDRTRPYFQEGPDYASLSSTHFKMEPVPDRSLYHQHYALREFFRALTHVHNLDRLLDYILGGISELYGVNKASIMLLDESRQFYRIKTSIGLDEMTVKSIKFNLAEGCPAWLSRFNQILRKDDASRNLYSHEGVRIYEQMESIQSAISAPLFTKGKLVGILNLGNKVTGKPFLDMDLELLSMIANYTAIIIENAILYREISFQKKYSENILMNITSGVITIDRSGRVTTYNKSAERILQVAAKEVIGKNVQKLGSTLADLLLRTLDGETSFHRHEIIYPSTRAPLGISTTVLNDDTGALSGAVMVFTDLTETKDLEKQKQAVERLQFWRNLANRLTQEIRNPLVAIKTFAQLLPERFQDDDFREDFYQIVTSEIDRLNAITEKLMEFGQPRENVLEEQDINDVIAQAILMHERKIAAKKVKLIKRLSREPLIALVDKKHVQDAIANLIDNSLDAIVEGGQLRISTSPCSHKDLSVNGNKDFVQIELQDSGIGISQDHLNLIFSPFFTTKVKGMGFGLTIAQRIIQDHDGKIEVLSEEGKGSKFRIFLPRVEKGAA